MHTPRETVWRIHELTPIKHRILRHYLECWLPPYYHSTSMYAFSTVFPVPVNTQEAKWDHPKVVQELLGHSQISITMNLYSHVLPSMQRDAMDNMDNFLKGNE